MREFFNLQLISAPESQNPDRETDVKRKEGGSLTPDLRGWKSPNRVIAGGERSHCSKHLVHNPTIHPSFGRPDYKSRKITTKNVTSIILV